MKILEHEEGLEERLAATHTERFRREMRLCARLHHPHIVRLVDTGEADGWLYTVFEFVPGRTLRDVLQEEGALPVEEAVHLMGQVLDAIGYAHDQGVIHRDLTPANVMISDSGLRRNALVLDFGISAFSDRHRTEESGRLTATDEAIGTPSYAAPEQLRGEVPTTKTDLYSWGLLLLECLAGERPVRGESLQEQLAQQLGPDPVEVPDAVRTLPVYRALARALEKISEDRAESAAELMGLLRAASSPIPARAPALDEGPAAASSLQPVTVLSVQAVWRSGGGAAAPQRIHDFQRHFDDVVRAHGGRSVAAMGSWIVAMFGYPDPTEQAARAALEAAVAVRDGGEAAILRAGVRSGQLPVPGEGQVGPADSTASAVVDEAMALAARADEGEILACGETRRRLRGQVPLEPLSGDADGVFRLAADSDALRSSFSTPTRMVGRAAELERLEAGWRTASQGRPQSLLVVGEPGIGKSRLIHELRRQLGTTRWIVCRCTPESEHSPLRPIVEWLSAVTGEFSLDTLLSELGLDVSELHPLLAELMGQPFHPDHPPSDLPPRRRREKVMEAILDLLFAEARREPLVFWVEDLHWADPTTLELLHELVRRVRAAEVFEPESDVPLLNLFTARPTFAPPWSLSDVPLVQLARLSQDEAEELARALSMRGARFAETEIGPMVERAGGVPFFLEEIARMAQDSTGRSGASTSTSIPSTLRDLLEARIAGLRTGVRRTAQQAACVGREFEFRLLALVAGREEEKLRDDLADLGRQGIVFRRAGLGGERYVFHHALLGDSARESMPETERRATHLEIAARLLEVPFEQVATQQPERLAYHFEEGGALERAIEFRQRAGFTAAARSAHPESIHHYERALELSMTFPEGPERDHAERSLRVLIGSAYMTTQGYAAEVVERSFERALELCSRYEEAPRLFSALNGLWAYNLVRGDAERTPALVVRMREVAESSGSERRLLFAHHAVGATAFYAGQLEDAEPALREATDRYEQASTEKSEGPAWQRHAGTAPMYLGWCLHLLGRPDEALIWKTRGLQLAERLRDVDAHVEAMTYGVALHHDRREPEAVLELSDRILPLAEEYGLDFWLGVAKAARGWARCHTGDDPGGLGEIDAGLSIFYRSGALLPLVYRACHVAEAHLLAGRSKDGLAALDDAFDRTPGRLDRFYDAEAHRLRGEFFALEGATEDAEAEFARAGQISRAQGARLFQLRTAASLVRLRRGTPRVAEAMEALRTAYDAFEGGRDLLDLIEARALLEEAS